MPDSLQSSLFLDTDDDEYIKSRNGTIHLDISHMKFRILIVCASFLKCKDYVKVWKEVMITLNRGFLVDDRTIVECLRISYDDLSEEEEKVFLDVACGLIREMKASAVRVWNSLQLVC